MQLECAGGYEREAVLRPASASQELNKMSCMIELVHVGQWIRHHRREHCMTLKQLASAVGSSASMLAAIENGRRHAQYRLLLDLSHVFDADMTVPNVLFMEQERLRGLREKP